MDSALHSEVNINWNETYYQTEKFFMELGNFFFNSSKLMSALEKFYHSDYGMTWDSFMHFVNATQHMDFSK